MQPASRSLAMIGAWSRTALTVLAATAVTVACGSSPGPCTVDYDCDGVQVCRVSTGECEAVVCSADRDCVGRDLACVENACVPRTCGADEDCGKDGYVCVDGACAVRQAA